MKKTFNYLNFIPSKAEEEACKANKTPFQLTRVLVEIKDVYPPPVLDYHSPWKIKKTLMQYEVVTGKIVVSFSNTFYHIFRYWTLAIDQNNPKRFCTDTIYFEMLPNDDYTLACMDLFNDRCLNIDDEIGIYWDLRSSTFQFKLLHKDI